MEDTASQASTSTSPGTAFSPPRPWENARPPKSILKRPPPPTKTFFGFTRDILPGSFSKFIKDSSSSSHSNQSLPPPTGTSFKAAGAGLLLPSAVPYDDSVASKSTSTSSSALKRAHFILPHLSTVYPISSNAAPSSAELTEAKREIEEQARELRRKEKEEGAGAWSLGRVEEFYRECCRTREENVSGGIVGAFRQANLIPPRTLDLTSVKLTYEASCALADVLSIEWGLRKLILRDCDLDEAALKPILHALLIPRSLPYLSLASNKKLKPAAFRLVGVFISESNTLEFLDLSHMPLDKRSIEFIVSSFQPAPAAPPEPVTDSLPATPAISSASISDYPLRAAAKSPLGITIPSNSRGISSPTVTSPTYSLPSSPQFPPLRSELPLRGAIEELETPLLSLRLDECQLRGGALDVLAHAIRPSSIQNLSLRSNRIGPTGAVAIALMMKDYPDSVPHASSVPSTPSQPSDSTTSPISPPPSHNSTIPPSSRPASPQPIVTVRSSVTAGAPSSASFTQSSFALRLGSLSLPPPRHPTLTRKAEPAPTPLAPQTTYTPYIPRSKRNMIASSASSASLSSLSSSTTVNGTTTTLATAIMSTPSTPTSGKYATYEPKNHHSQANGTVPVFTSSKTGGVTMRHLPPSSTNGSGNSSIHMISPPPGNASGMMDGHSAALLDKVRSLDALPRLGALQTLDLRGNDLRTGVTYIAQVLKRNRTLKILNLAENRIDVNGFVAIAEALKYNSTLETLDMSRNPCCGPSLDGVTAIRTAITINTALKRLFLSSTGMTSDGAIALAEFLPDARRLLHLDLTHNPLDLAGVMALNVGLKVNQIIRCLDVNVPPNNPEMAQLSREILRSCVRNTERVVNADFRSHLESSNASTTSSVAGPSIDGGLVDGSPQHPGTSSLSMSEDLDTLFGSMARGGVWGLIERSELARGVKQEVERERVGLEKKAMGMTGGKQKLEIWKKTPEEVMKAARDILREAHSPSTGESNTEVLLERSQVLVSVVVEMVQTEKDPTRLEELLELNDRLTSLTKDLKTGNAPYGPERPSVSRRNSKGKEKAAEKTDIILPSSFAVVNEEEDQASDDDDVPLRRRLSTLSAQDDREAPEGADGDAASIASAGSASTDLNKSWVEEEGEIFRRGNALLGPEEMEGDGTEISSEELKRELLEAQVERPRPRLDEEGVPIAASSSSS